MLRHLRWRIRRDWRNFSSLFTDDLWQMDLSDAKPSWVRLVRFIQLLRSTVDTFAKNRMGFQCVSLSYFVTLAIVPMVAFIFAVTGGLGLSDYLTEVVYRIFPASPDFIDIALDKANNIIDIAKGGGVGLISALLFLWAILWMMFQVERVFNNVWGIRKIPRKVYKRFAFYFLVLFLLPFIIMLFGSGIVAYLNLTTLIGLDLSDIKILPRLLAWLGFYILATFTLMVMYKFIPAIDVRFRYALKSAMVAAAIFGMFQYLYLETQVFVARLNTVYGVIAAVPLFLIWLNLSWQIIIYGAQLTRSYHQVNGIDNEQERPSDWEQEDR